MSHGDLDLFNIVLNKKIYFMMSYVVMKNRLGYPRESRGEISNRVREKTNNGFDFLSHFIHCESFGASFDPMYL